MADEDKSRQQLLQELQALRQRVTELQRAGQGEGYSDPDGAIPEVTAQNAGLLRETQRALAETEMLYSTSQRLASSSNLQQIVDAVTQSQAIAEMSQAALWLVEQGTAEQIEEFVAAAVWQSDELKPKLDGARVVVSGERLSAAQFPEVQAVPSVEPILIDDMREVHNLAPLARLLLGQHIISGAAALLPLRSGSRLLGVLALSRATAHRFSTQEVRWYESLAEQVSIALKNLQLIEQAQARLRQERVIREMTDRMQQARDLESLMRITAEELNRALRASHVYVQLGKPSVPASEAGGRN
jgi:GAF domain-containing protein